MSIFIRLIHVLFLSIFQSQKSSPFDPLYLTFRVWINEADMKYINQSRFLVYMEMGRWNWGVRNGYFKVLKKIKCLPIVNSQVARYQKPIKRFEKIKLKTQLKAVDDKFLYFHQSLFNSHGKVFSIGMVKASIKGSDGLIAPKDLWATVNIPLEIKELPDEFKKWDELESEMRSNIDHA